MLLAAQGIYMVATPAPSGAGRGPVGVPIVPLFRGRVIWLFVSALEFGTRYIGSASMAFSSK